MNGKTAILSVRIIGDAKNGIASFDQTLTAAERFERGIRRASQIAVIAILAIVAAALQLGQVASQFEQAQGGVVAVFGDQAAQVTALAQQAAQTTGLAEDEYSNMASIIGAQLRNMGVATDEQVARTSQLIAVGADLAATFGGPTSEAVAAISSLLRGERDPIERYGVSIKQVDIDARKAALGLAELTGDAEKAADMQATLSLLLDQTSTSTGMFAKEADTAAGQQARANAEWRNAQAALGFQLLPYMVQAAEAAADLAQWVGENEDLARNLAIGILILASAVLILRGAMAAATVAQWAFNVAAFANPVGLVVLLIIGILVLLGTIIYLVVTYWDTFEQAGVDAAIAVMNAMGQLIQIIQNVINALLEAIYWIQQFDIVGNAIRGAAGISFVPTNVQLPGAGATARGGASTSITNVFNVSGALDANGTAKAIAKVQRTDSRAVGSVGVGRV